jgi:hypothetical protein
MSVPERDTEDIERAPLEEVAPEQPPPVPADERWGEPYKYRKPKPAPFDSTTYWAIEAQARASRQREHDLQVERATSRMRQLSRRADIELLVRRAPRLPDGTLDYSEVADMPPPPAQPVRAPLPAKVDADVPSWVNEDDDAPESTGKLMRRPHVIRNYGRKRSVSEPRDGERGGGRWRTLGTSAWQSPPTHIVMTPAYVAAAFEYRFGSGMESEVRRVAKLTHPSRADKYLKDAVIAFVVRELPANRGNIKPVAQYLGVADNTISRWRARAAESDRQRYAFS